MSQLVCSSERLELYILEEEFLDDLAELLSRPKVQQYFPKTLSREECQDFIEKGKMRQQRHGYSFWAVVRKVDKQFLGICGLLAQDVEGVRELEVGYRIHDKFWGNGYGTEAALACMEYGKAHKLAESVISCILPENKASIRVAEKNGLTFEKEADFYGCRVNVYRKFF